jgi:hypothetical protein
MSNFLPTGHRLLTQQTINTRHHNAPSPRKGVRVYPVKRAKEQEWPVHMSSDGLQDPRLPVPSTNVPAHAQAVRIPELHGTSVAMNSTSFSESECIEEVQVEGEFKARIAQHREQGSAGSRCVGSIWRSMKRCLGAVTSRPKALLGTLALLSAVGWYSCLQVSAFLFRCLRVCVYICQQLCAYATCARVCVCVCLFVCERVNVNVCMYAPTGGCCMCSVDPLLTHALCVCVCVCVCVLGNPRPTIVIWVASSQLMQYIFDEENFSKPFFLTYFNTSLFTLYLFGFLIGAVFSCLFSLSLSLSPVLFACV